MWLRSLSQSWLKSSFQSNWRLGSRFCSFTSELNCEKPELPKCVQLMTPELKKRLAQNKTAKEMQFEALKAHLLDLFEHHDFPLPEALSEQQYGDLMKIHDNFNRLQYLDAVLKNAPDLDQTLQNIISKDELELQCLSITDEQRARLTKGSPSRNEGIDKILHRAEILYQSGQYVPCQLSDLHWCQLLDNYTDRALSKFFEFRLKTKHSKTIELMKKIQARSTTEQHRQNKAEKEEKTTSSPMVYGLTENCIFLRLSKSRMFQIGNWRAINEFKEWGQPLVLDFGMVKVMSMKDAKSVMMREVSIAISVNRASRSPFAIYVCNFDWNCPRCRFLIQFVPGIDKPESPVHITEQSYLDLFPKERLLYLTPNSRVDLMNYDDDDIYIIGALHDGLGKVPRTLSKSLEQGIRHARIPLRKVIGINQELTVHACFAMMLDFKASNDWVFASRHIPPRFLRYLSVHLGTKESEAMHYAANKMFPDRTDSELDLLTPQQHKKKFKEYVMEFMEAPDVRDYQGPAKFVVNKRQPSFASQSRGDPGDHEEAADNRRKFSQQRIVSSRNNNTRRETRDNTDYESFNDKAVGSRGRIATKSLHSNKRLSDSGNIEPQNTKSSIKNLLDIK